MLSPGFTGVGSAAAEKKFPDLSSRLLSPGVVATYLPSKVKKAGAKDCRFALARLLVCPLDVTRTSTGPSASSDGASTLICVGLMYCTNAGLPSMLTLTLSSDAGGPAASSSSVQGRLVVDRLAPAIVIHAVCVIPARGLAAFRMALMDGVGAM